MKRLKWLCIILGAVLIVGADVWFIRKVIRYRNRPAPTPTVAASAPAAADAEAPVDDLPPEARGDVPAIRPKWLQLPPVELVRLTNGRLTVHVTQPNDPGAYHDCRFDWSGMIASVEYNGHRFFNGPEAHHDDKTPYPVFGTAEEFGSEGVLNLETRNHEGGPLGFEEAKPGETFVKIGVGELVKPPAPSWYWWRIMYDVKRPGPWKVTIQPSSIQYEQDLKGPRGFAYRYVKTISIDPNQPVVRIARTLANTGQRRINTTHYTHNFVTFDSEDTITRGWQVQFGYPLKPFPNPRYWRTRGMVELEDQTLHFVCKLSGALFLFMTDQPRTAAENRFRIANPTLGMALSIQGDRPVYKIPLYVNNGAVCPEPFVQIRAEPGQEETWATSYTFEADPTRRPTSRPDRRDWRSTLKGALSRPDTTQPAN